MNAVKIGDRVRGHEVPSGAMALEPGSAYQDYAVRVANFGWYVGGKTRSEIDPLDRWNAFGSFEHSKPDLDAGWEWDLQDEVTIIALGLTGQETADDLRWLAEVFEIWERINPSDAIWRMTLEDMATPDDVCWVVARRELAKQLQNAGWLNAPLRTAESARRCLREVRS